MKRRATGLNLRGLGEGFWRMICWDRSAEASGRDWGVALASRGGKARYKLLKEGCLKVIQTRRSGR